MRELYKEMKLSSIIGYFFKEIRNIFEMINFNNSLYVLNILNKDYGLAYKEISKYRLCNSPYTMTSTFKIKFKIEKRIKSATNNFNSFASEITICVLDNYIKSIRKILYIIFLYYFFQTFPDKYNYTIHSLRIMNFCKVHLHLVHLRKIFRSIIKNPLITF